MDLPALPHTTLGLYRHYKGGEYEVIGVALDTIHKEGEVRDSQNQVTQFMETVVYRATYKIDEPQLTDQFGAFPMFTRTLESFNEVIMLPSGALGRRFTYVGPVPAGQSGLG